MFQTTNQMRFKQSHRVYIHSPQHVMASLVPSTMKLEWHGRMYAQEQNGRYEPLRQCVGYAISLQSEQFK